MNENQEKIFNDLLVFGQSATIDGRHINLKDLHIPACWNTYELSQRIKEAVLDITKSQNDG